MRVVGNVLFFCGFTLSCPTMGQVTAQDNATFRAELENVRALPYGYTATCDTPDLKMKSADSAIFVIRDSLLCALAIQHKPEPGNATFILCSNAPAIENSRNNASSPPKCVNLNLVFDAQEL